MHDTFNGNSGSSPPPSSVQHPNAAIVRKFIEDHPDVYAAMLEMARRRLGGGRNYWIKRRGRWKLVTNITSDDRATTAVHDAIIRGMTSKTPYRGNREAMTPWFLRILDNRIKDRGREERLEREVHAALVAEQIARERLASPMLARTPPTTHTDLENEDPDDAPISTPSDVRLDSDKLDNTDPKQPSRWRHPAALPGHTAMPRRPTSGFRRLTTSPTTAKLQPGARPW